MKERGNVFLFVQVSSIKGDVISGNPVIVIVRFQQPITHSIVISEALSKQASAW